MEWKIVDDGLAWSMAISKKTGKVVLSASGDGVAYVVSSGHALQLRSF